METTFYLKKLNKSESTIYFKITRTGDIIRISTKLKIENKDWDNTKPKIINSTKEIRNILSNYKNSIDTFIISVTQATLYTPTQQQIKEFISNMMNGVSTTSLKVSKLITQYIQFKENDVTKSTTIKITYDLNDFAEHVNGLDIRDLNKDVVKSYRERVKKYNSGKQISTINNYIKNVKAFLNYLYLNDYTTINHSKDLLNFKAVEKDLIAISTHELAILENWVATSDRLLRIRDLFLFGCYTGQRFEDCINLNVKDIEHFTKNNVVESVWTFRQQKTKNVVSVPLLKQALNIIEKNEGFIKISNDKINKYLKELFTLLNLKRIIKTTDNTLNNTKDSHKPLNEVISFSVSRKSFITIALTKGMTAKMVQKISGHRKDAIFNRYVNFSKADLSSEMDKWNG